MPSWAWAIPPVLFAIHPAVSLLASNLPDAVPADALRPALASGALGLIAFTAAWIVLRRLWKACLVACLIILVFFSYGPVYMPLKAVEILGVTLGRHRILLPALVVALALIAWRVALSPSSGRLVFPVLALVSLAAPLPPAVQVVLYTLRARQTSLRPSASAPAGPVLHLRVAGPAARPDIYFIILDAHAREDVVRDYYGDTAYDFPEALRAMGFVVADEARSNYLRTVLSVPATLNMEYLDELGIDLLDPDYQIPLTDALAHSRTRSLLEGIGYSMYAVTSSYRPTEIVDADHYLAPEMGELDRLEVYWAFTNFEQLLVRQSALVALLDLQTQLDSSAAGFLAQGLDNAKAIRREIVLSALRNLEEAPRIPGPKFYFVHIISPHYPYLFGPSGEVTDYPIPTGNEDTLVLPGTPTWTRYRDQMEFIDDEIARIVRGILAQSATPPVILIHSDHGPDTGTELAQPDSLSMHHRTAILSAAYLPTECRDDYYPSVSSVNTFRIVLNCLFDAGLPLKADRSFLDDETTQGLVLFPLPLPEDGQDSEVP
ncbi:MAG: hypothetical protein WD906_07165 [Anaerolineales bacterium]